MSRRGASVLSQAVRPRVLLRVLGDLLLVSALLLVPPLLFAAAGGDLRVPLRLAGVIATLVLAGLGLRRLPAPPPLQINEALVLAALIFALNPLCAWPALLVPGVSAGDALFEAISGVTTTGLTTLASVADKPRSFLFARAWLQWYGGLGFVVLSLALAMGPGIAARRLGAALSQPEGLMESSRAHARHMSGVYAGLTAIGIAALWLGGARPFEALLYALSAVSTGGFAPHDGSLAELPHAALRGLVIALCVAGAVSLPLYRRLRQRGVRELLADPELRALALAGLLVALALLWFRAPGAGPLPRDGLLLAFSAQTTAGFSSVDVAVLEPAAKLALIGAMLVGGSVGSTAGGVKLLRILIALQVLRLLLLRTRLPGDAVAEPELGGHPLLPDEIQRALLVAGLFGLAIGLSWLPFLAAGYPALDALFEVVSALGTVGLSSGVCEPGLPGPLRAVLAVDMLLGRLEILAVLVALSPASWIGRRSS